MSANIKKYLSSISSIQTKEAILQKKLLAASMQCGIDNHPFQLSNQSVSNGFSVSRDIAKSGMNIRREFVNTGL